MNGLIRIIVFTVLVVMSMGSSHASELDEELQAIQAKLESLNKGEEPYRCTGAAHQPSGFLS